MVAVSLGRTLQKVMAAVSLARTLQKVGGCGQWRRPRSPRPPHSPFPPGPLLPARPTTHSPMEPPEYATAADAETRGLHAALTRACALEARLRSAVQASHPISSSLELDPSSADREREALLATR